MNVEKELIKSCIKEDRKAQSELYRLCYSIMLSVCLRYERNKEEAEFMLNLAFFKILQNLKNYQTSIPFEAWIRRITINTVIDEYRKNKRRREKFIEESTSVAKTESLDFNTADQKFDAEDLEQMIRQLPPTTKKVFNLYAIDGYSHKEISEMLNMSEGTSKWHLSSGRQKLREMMSVMMESKAKA